ncbi:MAG TPA: NAD(P)/FAD-dependent oxidoreductase [Gemmatimonadales bacterium]|jgi:halogenation protein CepH|nr:NAD(P)/FAD-dependent oxidoreductase [Gemmatimonadales bacterium]
MQQVERFDVVVIGGGPGGSGAGAFLARNGLKVLVLEREKFPRFHIGESLLPAGWELFEKIGVTKDIEDAGFVLKQGIMFGMFQKPEVKLLTAEYPQYFVHPWAWHVERAKFDQVLLNNARKQGAEVREEWTVKEVIFEGDRSVGVMAGPNGQAPHRIEAPMVVDATGRDCMIARRMGWRKPDPVLNKIAHFTHFKGAFRRDSKDVVDIGPVFEGSVTTDIYTIDGGWIWYIPLSNDIVSVGAVLDARHARSLGNTPQERFEKALASEPTMLRFVGDSKQTMEMQTISNISYLNDEFVGNGFVLVGDASMFVDPIFSAGVTLAIRGGVYAGECILDCFKHNDFSAARLKPYEKRIKHPMHSIFKMIYNWYSILDKKDADNIINRARQIPLLRERFIVLLSGGYDKMDLEGILTAAGENPADKAHFTLAETALKAAAGTAN